MSIECVRFEPEWTRIDNRIIQFDGILSARGKRKQVLSLQVVGDMTEERRSQIEDKAVELIKLAISAVEG